MRGDEESYGGYLDAEPLGPTAPGERCLERRHVTGIAPRPSITTAIPVGVRLDVDP